jgi:hypothetical protein
MIYLSENGRVLGIALGRSTPLHQELVRGFANSAKFVELVWWLILQYEKSAGPLARSGGSGGLTDQRHVVPWVLRVQFRGTLLRPHGPAHGSRQDRHRFTILPKHGREVGPWDVLELLGVEGADR